MTETEKLPEVEFEGPMGRFWSTCEVPTAALLEAKREIEAELERRAGLNVVVAAAGAFDPLHSGHVAHLRAARALGDKLVVLLNPDEHLVAKKGYAFMTFAERREILLELRCVDYVIEITDGDGTCALTLARAKPDIFAKGGDRTPDRMPQNEVDVCREIGLRIVYGVGGEKTQSSSELVRTAREHIKT